MGKINFLVPNIYVENDEFRGHEIWNLLIVGSVPLPIYKSRVVELTFIAKKVLLIFKM